MGFIIGGHFLLSPAGMSGSKDLHLICGPQPLLTEAVGVHEVGGWGGICEYKKCYTCSFTTDCLFKTHMQLGFAFIMGVKVSL